MATKRQQEQRRRLISIALIVMAVLALAIIVTANYLGVNPTQFQSQASINENEFLTVSGKNLVYKGQVIRLRGMHENNVQAYCSAADDACSPNAIRINALDYQKLSSMNANVLRFGMSYSWYRDNKDFFYQKMDEQIEWARQNRIFLIPTLMELPGDCYEGWQRACPIWDNNSNGAALRDQYKNFWADFSYRYRYNPVIAAYGLINEPSVVIRDGNSNMWFDLAQQTIDRIRLQDPRHAIIVATDWGNRFNRTFGPKVIYEIHDYLTTHLTHSTGAYATYPGNAPEGVGATQQYYWDRERFLTGAGKYEHSAEFQLSQDFSNNFSVPIIVGEYGAGRVINSSGTNIFPTYKNLISDKTSIYHEPTINISYILHEWRGDDGIFSMYKDTLTNNQLVSWDNSLVTMMQGYWSSNVRPNFPTSIPSPTPFSGSCANPYLGQFGPARLLNSQSIESPTCGTSSCPSYQRRKVFCGNGTISTACRNEFDASPAGACPAPTFTPTPAPVNGYPKIMTPIAGGNPRIRIVEQKEPSGGKVFLKAEAIGLPVRKVLWYLNGAWQNQDAVAPYFFGGDTNGNPNGWTFNSSQLNRVRVAVFYNDTPNGYIGASANYLGCIGTALGDLVSGEMKVGNCDQNLFSANCSPTQRPRVFCLNGVVTGACRDQNSSPSVPTCATPQYAGSCNSPIGVVPRGTSVTANICNGYGCGSRQRLRVYCDPNGRLFQACRDHKDSPPAPICLNVF